MNKKLYTVLIISFYVVVAIMIGIVVSKNYVNTNKTYKYSKSSEYLYNKSIPNIEKTKNYKKPTTSTSIKEKEITQEDKVEPQNTTTKTKELESSNGSEISSIPTTSPITSASVISQTQYAHTENGHNQGDFFNIYSSEPSIEINSDSTTISGIISRNNNIGLEKGSIVLNYTLSFNNDGSYRDGSITSSGYVVPTITVTPGVNYKNQNVQFITTTEGRANSGSIVYPILSTITLNWYNKKTQ